MMDNKIQIAEKVTAINAGKIAAEFIV